MDYLIINYTENVQENENGDPHLDHNATCTCICKVVCGTYRLFKTFLIYWNISFESDLLGSEKKTACEMAKIYIKICSPYKSNKNPWKDQHFELTRSVCRLVHSMPSSFHSRQSQVSWQPRYHRLCCGSHQRLWGERIRPRGCLKLLASDVHWGEWVSSYRLQPSVLTDNNNGRGQSPVWLCRYHKVIT